MKTATGRNYPRVGFDFGFGEIMFGCEKSKPMWIGAEIKLELP